MRLKVSRDQPRTSDVVEVASRRCLVGSAPRCDVRVDAPGVAPVACLIFHGSQHNVVRWIDASQEAAGGELFQDEILSAGDPLQIGPVELELLVDEIMASDEPAKSAEVTSSGEDRLAEYISRLERLENQLVELQQASDATDRDLWSSEKAELEALLQSRLRDFDGLQDEVQRLRDELTAVRGEYGHLTANQEAGQRLAEVSQELAERSAGFEREQTNWERDRGEFTRQLQHHQERLEQFESQLAEQSTRQAKSEAARQAAETRADRLQESVDELSQRLAQQQEDYEAVRATWEAERASLESELAETQQRLADAVTVEPTRVAIGNPMDRLLAGSSLPDDRGDETDGPLQAFLALGPTRCDDAEPQHAEVIESAGEYGRSADTASNYYEQAFSGLRSAAHLNDATDDEDAFENPLSMAMESNTYGRAFEATEPACDEGEEIAFQGASTAPPVSTADVLARLGKVGPWSDNETVAEDTSAAFAADSPHDVLSRFATPKTAESQPSRPQHTADSAAPFTSAFAKPTSGSNDEEESIEAYMSRLMNRVRGTNESDEPTPRMQPTLERTPVTEYTEVTKAPQPVREPEPLPFNPEEYKPRRQAPELADRMTAMRSLANDSARTAIASHAKRNWSSVMQLKLLVSVFAFVSVLASIIFFWGDPVLMGLGSLLGVGLLVYWARTAITYRRLLLDSMMLEPEGGHFDDSRRGEDAA